MIINQLRIKLFLLLFVMVLPAFAQNSDTEAYYAAIELEGKAQEELKTTLSNLLKQHTVIPYGYRYSNGEGRTFVYLEKIDLREDGTISDMYSNVKRYFKGGGNSVSGINIEHCLPKSWWGGTEVDAYFDLHHLSPSDASANQEKSNFILGKAENPYTFSNGVSTTGYAFIKELGPKQMVYEPADEYKGDFARIYFYMSTCYQDYIWTGTAGAMLRSENYPTLREWAKEMLLQWHRQDPVSEKEIKRNDGVYTYQHNRNPFVDMPELAEYIWGNYNDQPYFKNGYIKPRVWVANRSLHIESPLEDAVLHVMDFSGRICQVSKIRNGVDNIIPLNKSDGVYIISIKSERINIKKKIVVF